MGTGIRQQAQQERIRRTERDHCQLLSCKAPQERRKEVIQLRVPVPPEHLLQPWTG